MIVTKDHKTLYHVHIDHENPREGEDWDYDTFTYLTIDEADALDLTDPSKTWRKLFNKSDLDLLWWDIKQGNWYYEPVDVDGYLDVNK